MKKIIIVILSLVLLTGCGTTDEEKTTMFYNSLEKAYASIYITEGVGLPVYEDSKVTLKDVNWYKTANSTYNSYEKIEDTINSVFTGKLNEELNKVLARKYREIDAELYTTGTGGCILDYQIDDTLMDNLKKDVTISKIKGKKITFKYKDKEYTAKKSDNVYVFGDKVFECN